MPQRPPVPQGTRLLIGLQDALSTKDDKAGKRFVATTLEPVTTAEGNVIPAGVQIRGHIDKVQSAGKRDARACGSRSTISALRADGVRSSRN